MSRFAKLMFGVCAVLVIAVGVSVRAFGGACTGWAKINSLSINTGGPYSTSLSPSAYVTFTSSGDVNVRVSMGGTYWNAEKRVQLFVSLNTSSATVSHVGSDFLDWSVRGAKAQVTQSVYNNAGVRIAHRSRFVNTGDVNIRQMAGVCKILGGGAVRVNEEWVSGYYWEPLIAEYWFR